MAERVEKKASHKTMDSTSPEYIFPPDLYPDSPERDFSSEGGLLVDKNCQPQAYIRGPFWRTEKNDPAVREDDVDLLFRRPETSNIPFGEIDAGGELELYFWNDDPGNRETYPVMREGSPITTALTEINNGNGVHFIEEDDIFGAWPEEIAFSPELVESCLELNFEHFTDPSTRGAHQLKALQILARIAEENKALVIPTASFPHRPLTPEETNPHPYIQRIAMEFMGWENVRHFIGSSWQTHVEMISLETALAATNYLQQVAPIIHALTLAGPFIDGRVFLSQENLPGMAEEPSLWHSVRYWSRFKGSPEGGVLRAPLPEKEGEFWQLAAEKLATGEIVSPARVGGHHTDFRIRPDLKPYGTIEIAFMDTAGAHPLKLLALQEFFRALSWKLQRFVLENKREELPPLLFGKLDQARLAEIHQASIAVSKNGIEAEIKAADGQTYPLKELWDQLLAWVDQPIPEWGFNGLPQGIKEELNKSAEVVDGKTFESFTDNEGLVSSYGFYKTGKGTLSQWLLARAYQMVERGISEKEAIINCMDDLGYSFHQYLKEIDEQTIKELLE